MNILFYRCWLSASALPHRLPARVEGLLSGIPCRRWEVCTEKVPTLLLLSYMYLCMGLCYRNTLYFKGNICIKIYYAIFFSDSVIEVPACFCSVQHIQYVQLREAIQQKIKYLLLYMIKIHFCFFFRLYKANGFGKPFGPKSQVGDRIGCGIKFPKLSADQENPAAQNMAKVFFTHNGKEVIFFLFLMK